MRRGAVVLLVGAMGVAACSADPSPPEAAGWVDLLARVPDTPETRAELVRGVDIERAWEAAGGGEFTADMTQAEIDRAMRAFFDADVWPLAAGRVWLDLSGDEATAAARELGFGLADVDRTMNAGGAAWLDVVAGDFDGEAIATAAQETAWGNDVVVGSSGDFTTYAWGPDLVRVADRRDGTRIVIADPDVTAAPTAPPTTPTTPAVSGDAGSTPTSLVLARPTTDARVEPERHPSPGRPLGYGQRLGISPDGTLLWALTDAGLDGGIGAAAGSVPSLVDDDNIRLAAEVLDGLQTYSFTLSFGDVGIDRPNQVIEWAGEPPPPEEDPALLLEPYSTVALGGGVDGDGHFAALVFVFDDSDAATESAARLETRLATEAATLTGMPWSELFTSADVTADGRAVTVLLRGEHVSKSLDDAFLRRETIIWSE